MGFSLTAYLKESVAELRKVTWPTRQEALRSTGIVIVFTASVSLFLGAVDYLYNLGLDYLINLS